MGGFDAIVPQWDELDVVRRIRAVGVYPVDGRRPASVPNGLYRIPIGPDGSHQFIASHFEADARFKIGANVAVVPSWMAAVDRPPIQAGPNLYRVADKCASVGPIVPIPFRI